MSISNNRMRCGEAPAIDAHAPWLHRMWYERLLRIVREIRDAIKGKA
jgi:hypothetical protein